MARLGLGVTAGADTSSAPVPLASSRTRMCEPVVGSRGDRFLLRAGAAKWLVFHLKRHLGGPTGAHTGAHWVRTY